MYGLLLINL